ncbi:MAG: GNAT family N-acetyltransferase [Candidatus Hodarchaeales archaeon]|jgi:GNAT superfamily N-acetyltransferase
MDSESNKEDQDFLSIILRHQPLSVISYILWFHHTHRDQIEFNFSLNPFSYIYRFENKYNLVGNNFWELRKEIRWFKENITLIFQNKDLWNTIVNSFENFRSVETNNPTHFYDTYLTYTLSRDQLSSVDSNTTTIAEIPSKNFPLPKRYRHLGGGVNFGLIKNETIVCFAAAPHILTQFKTPFAILRGIETKKTERKHGHARATVSKLCKILFSKYGIESIFLWVEEKNVAARNLYTELGFQEEAKIFTTYCDQKTR